MQVTVCNRGPEEAPLHVLPQLWFRNTWSWQETEKMPQLSVASDGVVEVSHPVLDAMRLTCDGEPKLLFCENETNAERLFGQERQGRYFKDGIHDFVVSGDQAAVNPNRTGTKCAAHYRFVVPARNEVTIRCRLSKETLAEPFADFARVVTEKRKDADAFYAALQEKITDADEALVQRQGDVLAGLPTRPDQRGVIFREVRCQIEGTQDLHRTRVVHPQRPLRQIEVVTAPVGHTTPRVIPV